MISYQIPIIQRLFWYVDSSIIYTLHSSKLFKNFPRVMTSLQLFKEPFHLLYLPLSINILSTDFLMGIIGNNFSRIVILMETLFGLRYIIVCGLVNTPSPTLLFQTTNLASMSFFFRFFDHISLHVSIFRTILAV